MLIDCDTCAARPRACRGCVVSHLLSAGSGEDPVTLDAREWVAVGTLAAAGLVPPLRLVPRPAEDDMSGLVGLGDADRHSA
jgi:hypothetical protein